MCSDNSIKTPIPIDRTYASATLFERDDADHKQEGCHRRDVERENLNNKRRADVGSQHDGEHWDQIDRAASGKGGGHQPGRSAALQECRHTEASEEREGPVP